MTLTDAGIFFGRFHPLLVHLPIGFLLLAAILALLGRGEKYQAIQPAISFALLAGAICAVLACITGYILSFSGDYDPGVLTTHMWGGIVTAAISVVAYLLSSRKVAVGFLRTGKPLLITLFIMVVMISITGHLGGTLTHGSGYISSDLLFGKTTIKKQVTDINEAVVYDDLVQPMLKKKCSGCHNSSKKKGELSMETYVALLKGGKHGAVIEAGNTNKSELIKRVTLDPKDEKFMPSDGKPALSEEEKNILAWWIAMGAAGDKKVKDLKASATVKKDMVSYLGLQSSTVADSDQSMLDSNNNFYAHLTKSSVSEQQVNALKQLGFVIKYINLQPVLLDVTLPGNKNAIPNAVSGKLKELLQLKDNITWLNISGNNITDGQLELISQFKNLQRLRLDNNPITDAGIAKLQSLVNAESINLYNTKVSSQSVAILSSLTKLKHLYVWGTGITRDEKTDSIKIVTGVN